MKGIIDRDDPALPVGHKCTIYRSSLALIHPSRHIGNHKPSDIV